MSEAARSSMQAMLLPDSIFTGGCTGHGCWLADCTPWWLPLVSHITNSVAATCMGCLTAEHAALIIPAAKSLRLLHRVQLGSQA